MGTSGFKVKTENDSFVVICSRCRQNLKLGDFTFLFCGVRQRNDGNSCCTCSTSIFPFLANHILALWCCRSRSRRLCLNSLLLLLLRLLLLLMLLLLPLTLPPPPLLLLSTTTTTMMMMIMYIPWTINTVVDLAKPRAFTAWHTYMPASLSWVSVITSVPLSFVTWRPEGRDP